MYSAEILNHASNLTFGRNTAQFKQLVAFLATVSLVLWACVAITLLARMWMCHVWYRRRYPDRHQQLPPP